VPRADVHRGQHVPSGGHFRTLAAALRESLWRARPTRRRCGKRRACHGETRRAPHRRGRARARAGQGWSVGVGVGGVVVAVRANHRIRRLRASCSPVGPAQVHVAQTFPRRTSNAPRSVSAPCRLYSNARRTGMAGAIGRSRQSRSRICTPVRLVQADDVLVGGRVIVDVQDVIALGAELVVVRREPHLLPMRPQVRVPKDPSDRRLAHVQVQIQRLQRHGEQPC